MSLSEVDRVEIISDADVRLKQDSQLNSFGEQDSWYQGSLLCIWVYCWKCIKDPAVKSAVKIWEGSWSFCVFRVLPLNGIFSYNMFHGSIDHTSQKSGFRFEQNSPLVSKAARNWLPWKPKFAKFIWTAYYGSDSNISLYPDAELTPPAPRQLLLLIWHKICWFIFFSVEHDIVSTPTYTHHTQFSPFVYFGWYLHWIVGLARVVWVAWKVVSVNHFIDLYLINTIWQIAIWQIIGK